MSIDQRIREGLRGTNDRLSVPSVDAALAAVTADGRATRRRSLVAVMAAAAAVVAVIAGLAALKDDQTGSPQPVDPAKETTSPSNPLVNGPIQVQKDYLGEVRPGCHGCFVDEGRNGVFDQDTGTVLFVSDRAGPSTTISVVSPDGTLAELACGKDFACPGVSGERGVVSGPGDDELTFWSQDDRTADQRPSGAQQLTVMGFDGTARFTMDLMAGIPQGEHAVYLAWSPDGSRLAVTTRENTGPSGIHRIWLVHRDGSEPQLVYTASDTGPDGEGPAKRLSRAAWHPDGSKLGLIEARSAGLPDSPDTRTWTRVVSLLLPEPGHRDPGATTILQEFDDWCACSEPAFLWAPDGTRVAIVEPNSDLNERERVLELSAEDGRVLARRPLEGYPLVWPARHP